MASLCSVTLFIALLAVAGAPRPTNKEWKAARAKEAAAKASAEADAKKTAAVDKVVNMLEDLTQKVLAEGEAEAASYNKFACFCKTVQKDKANAIKEEKDESASLTADINSLSRGRASDDKDIAADEKTIRQINDDDAKAIKTNTKRMNEYADVKADLAKAISSIENALKTLKSSKPSLLQLRSASNTVQEAMAMADALGLGVDTLHGPAAALLQGAPEVEMENYKFHAGGVIKTLEQLLDTFRVRRNKKDSTEVERLRMHDMKMQNDADKIKAKTLEMEHSQKAREEKIADIAENSQALTQETAALRTDQEYLSNLYNMCKKKAETWDRRSQVRADELSAITAAVTIVKGAVRESTSKSTIRFAQRGVSVRFAEALARDDDAMAAVEEEAEEKDNKAKKAAPRLNFLQRHSVSKHATLDPIDRVSQLLSSVGGKTKSSMLVDLAHEISVEKPRGLEKVKTLVEELVSRLEAEMANEATQKGWCDKSTSDAVTKRTTTRQTVDELNDQLAKLEADIRKLGGIQNDLNDEISELRAAQIEQDNTRFEEMTENKATVAEAQDGLKAINSAIDILQTFYKGAAKEKDDKFEEKEKSPDAGFSGGDAYKGSQSDATGVLGMLDVIKSDFVRTIKETKQSEEESMQDYKAFTDQTQTTFKESRAILKARTQERREAESKETTLKKQLKKETDLLVSVTEELMELKKACVDTGMSYKERKARRLDEIAALRKALCILDPDSLSECKD